MPYKEREVKKLYYSISEVAAMLNVKASLIRFWEKEFDSLQPKKNAKGNRQYTDKDILELKAIHNLVREKGYRIDGAKKVFRAEKKELGKNEKVKQSLLDLRAELMLIANSL